MMLQLIVASLLLAPQASASPASAMPAASPSGAPAASAAPAATPMPSPAAAAPPPANFGSPPGGEIPILYNDHHVYATPDSLKQGRVLAALVRGSTILIPLRSMFEQMGATVSYDPGTKAVHVTKSGADVQLTVGSPQVTINGETRPLDVPAEMYHGSVMVPIRVISEGMGAYVQWVPDRRIVVVRYVVPTPAPPPPPPPPSTAPAATPTPAPPPKRKSEAWIAGDAMVAGKSYDEFSAGLRQTGSWTARAGTEFSVGIPLMIAFNFVQYQYPHNNNGGTCPGDPGCVTIVGGGGQTSVPAFTVRENYSDVRLGIKVLDPRIYVVGGWLWNTANQGYPTFSGAEFGAEKIPDLDQMLSWYAGYWFLPNIRGTYTGLGQSLPMQYSLQQYAAGVTWTFSKSFPVFVDVGYAGNRGNAKANSPSGYTHNGLYVGLGYGFSLGL